MNQTETIRNEPPALRTDRILDTLDNNLALHHFDPVQHANPVYENACTAVSNCVW